MLEAVIKKQIVEGLEHLDESKKSNCIVIAYEPVWSIGTGKIPQPQEIEHVCF